MTELKDLQQLYILADETQKHYLLSFQDPMGSDVRNRRIDTIKTNNAALVASIQYLIDQEVYSC